MNSSYNTELEKEQLFYLLRDAQNSVTEIGQVLSGGNLGPQEVQHMEQLNSRVGQFLQQLHQHLEKEIKI